MKIIFSSLFLIVLLSDATFAQEGSKPPTIDVVGTADIMVEPDEVVLSLDVTKRNKILAVAKSEADAALSKIIALTKKFDVGPEHVRTLRISVDMKYQSIRDPQNRIYDEDGDEIGTRTFLGYEASTTVVVKLKDLKKFEKFYDEILGTGVSEVNSVSFESSKMIEHVKNARLNAMKAAFDKATAMAGAIGQTIGKAISINERAAGNSISLGVLSTNSNTPFIPSTRTGPTLITEGVTTFSPGTIKISSQVAVTFLLN